MIAKGATFYHEIAQVVSKDHVRLEVAGNWNLNEYKRDEHTRAIRQDKMKVSQAMFLLKN